MRPALFLMTFILLSLGSGAQIYYVQDMSTTQIDSLDRDKTVVLLPGGILEEHGPYLPCFTDGYMNLSLTQSIAQSIVKRRGMKVLIFPLIPLGNGGANEVPRKFNFSGTYTIRQNTLRSVLMDLASEIGDQGFKKIFVIHMHGAPNHNLAIDEACAYFTESYKGRMVNVWNLAVNVHAPSLSPELKKEEGYTVHAGTGEHSMLYYLKPQFQKLNYKSAKPVFAAGPNELANVGKKEGWPGYWGSPRNASVAFGKKVWTALTEGITQQVQSVLDNTYDFTKPTFYQMMKGDLAQKAVNDDAIQHDKEKEAKQKEWLRSKGIE